MNSDSQPAPVLVRWQLTRLGHQALPRMLHLCFLIFQSLKLQDHFLRNAARHSIVWLLDQLLIFGSTPIHRTQAVVDTQTQNILLDSRQSAGPYFDIWNTSHPSENPSTLRWSHLVYEMSFWNNNNGIL